MGHRTLRKRVLTLLLLLSLLGAGFTAGALFTAGADTSEWIPVYRNLIRVQVNGQTVTMDNFLYNNRTYVPMREVAELLGKDVRWNAYTRTAGIHDMIYEKLALSALLPEAAGYTWRVHGFAEYGHTLTLNRIEDQEDHRRYQITGNVEDVSSGESSRDFSISLSYLIQGNALIQEKRGPLMLDSKFDRLTLLETPLEAGTTWTETLTDSSGRISKIDAILHKVEIVSGKKEYTVRYQEVGSDYFEVRVLREGVGVTRFERSMTLAGETFTAGYALSAGGMLNTLPLTLYFALPQAAGLAPEIREMTVIDGAVARAAMEGLIQGPRTPGLVGVMPEGTRLLDIVIEHEQGLCTVDFSKAFIENHPGGSAGELMTLNAIVQTLKQFPTIQKVQILVEGQKGATLGNILLDKPLE